MPSPKLYTMREMLAAFRYDMEGKSAQALWNAAMRRTKTHGLKVKDIDGQPRLWYASSVDAAINSARDHQFQAAA